MEYRNKAIDGYKGIWSFKGSLLSQDEYCYMHYSGGLGTSFQQILPLAIYSKEAHKTFFCYGGKHPQADRILIMVSYYDHATGCIPRPTGLIDKQADDTHDNPSIALDDWGHIWVFANAHGMSGRPACIFKSTKPWSTDEFEIVLQTSFSYAQPWFVPQQGFFCLQTRYTKQGERFLYWQTSYDGASWSLLHPLARIGRGHYQISMRQGSKIGTAFNCHPQHGGCRSRTNLYYLETCDMGKTWQSVDGQCLELPLVQTANSALVKNYAEEGLLVFFKDMNFDAQGNPVILYLTCRGDKTGPDDGPRHWMTARWTGSEWVLKTITTSDNCYDTGGLYIESDGLWRIIGPTESGPQSFNTGGEVAMWTSADQGEIWAGPRFITRNSPFNHTYVRRPIDAHPGFYAFWADGDTRAKSPSRLYFADQQGAVFRLPWCMTSPFMEPEKLDFVL